MSKQSTPFSASKTVKQGWECMATGRYDEARERFTTAAQADPFDQDARDGLLEALKARSTLYRMSLRFGLRTVEAFGTTSRFSPVLIVIAFSAVISLLVKAIRTYPSAAPVLWPIAGGIAIMFVLMQCADYEATLRVWFSPLRRLAMTRWELLISVSGLLCIAMGCVSLILFVVERHAAYVIGSIFAFVLTHVVDTVADAKPTVPRVVMYAYFSGTALLGLVACLMTRATTAGTSMDEKIPASLAWPLVLFLLAVGLCGVVAKLASRFETKGEFIDHGTHASSPGGLSISDGKLRAFHPEIYGFRALFHNWLYPDREVSVRQIHQFLREHLRHGDTQPAVVLSIEPLRIAAYSEDMDCVALLAFDEKLVSEFALKRGTKMLAVNTYSPDPFGGEDLVEGENAHGTWHNFTPLIAEFLSDDALQIDNLKRKIPTEAWTRAARMGVQRMKAEGQPPRDGRPLCVHVSHAAITA